MYLREVFKYYRSLKQACVPKKAGLTSFLRNTSFKKKEEKQMAKKIAHISFLLVALAILLSPLPGVGALGAWMLQKNPLAQVLGTRFIRTTWGRRRYVGYLTVKGRMYNRTARALKALASRLPRTSLGYQPTLPALC
jgi:hypothetical protein